MDYIKIHSVYSAKIEKDEIATAIEELSKNDKIIRPVIITDKREYTITKALDSIGINKIEKCGHDIRFWVNNKFIRIIHITKGELNEDDYPRKILAGCLYDGLVDLITHINTKWYARFINEAFSRLLPTKK